MLDITLIYVRVMADGNTIQKETSSTRSAASILFKSHSKKRLKAHLEAPDGAKLP